MAVCALASAWAASIVRQQSTAVESLIQVDPECVITYATQGRLTMLERARMWCGERQPRDVLELESRRMTDTGLENLRGLRQLRRLALDFSNVTDAGLVYVQVCEDLEWLSLNNTNVSDSTIAYLRLLKKIRHLCIIDTAVSNTARDQFQEDHPQAFVMHRRAVSVERPDTRDILESPEPWDPDGVDEETGIEYYRSPPEISDLK